MKKLLFYFYLLLVPLSLFAQPATKEDIKLLIEQMREDHRILREDMNQRFEQVDKQIEILRDDMNKRFEQVDKRFEQVNKQIEVLRDDMNHRFQILFWAIGLLFVLNCGFLAYLWKEQRRLEANRYDIKNFAYQLYRAEPEIKAEIFFHLQKEAEKIKQKTAL